MADIKISELPLLTNVEDSDFLVVNDVSSATTKKITRERFLFGLPSNITDSGSNVIISQDATINNDLIVGGDIDATGDISFGSLTDVVGGIIVNRFIGSGIQNHDSNGAVPTSAAVIDYITNSLIVNYKFTLGVDSSGSAHYTFSDSDNIWFPTIEDDPVLYLRRGEVYTFVNNSGGGHPFQIRVSAGGVAYNTGVTNNGAATGNVVFKIPMSAPATLYYQCTNHAAMGNTINIV